MTEQRQLYDYSKEQTIVESPNTMAPSEISWRQISDFSTINTGAEGDGGTVYSPPPINPNQNLPIGGSLSPLISLILGYAVFLAFRKRKKAETSEAK